MKGHSGGKRPGAGRKPTKRTKSVEHTEAAPRDLLLFMDDLSLEPGEANHFISKLVSEALREYGDQWRKIFGNTLRSRVRDFA